MKTFLILLLVGSSLLVNAQTNPNQLNAQIKIGLEKLANQKSASDLTNAADYFENLATKEKQQWLVQYYAAYSNLILGIKGNQDEETKDDTYDKAMKYANNADSLSSNNSEIFVLKGYITFMKMAVQPRQRAMGMIPAANKYIEKALTLNSENPRAYLLKGQNAFYTPEMFGGGKDDAKISLIKAQDKFEKFTANGLEPNWGKLRVDELLKEYN